MAGMLLILAASPYTECAWHWDRFPRGGSDFELGLVACVAMVCLALVVTLQAKCTLARQLGALLRHTGGAWGLPRFDLAAGVFYSFLRIQAIHRAPPPIAAPMQI
jgi:hypothetical protein